MRITSLDADARKLGKIRLLVLEETRVLKGQFEAFIARFQVVRDIYGGVQDETKGHTVNFIGMHSWNNRFASGQQALSSAKFQGKVVISYLVSKKTTKIQIPPLRKQKGKEFACWNCLSLCDCGM